MNADAALRARVDAARTRTLAWLDAMQAPNEPPGISCISPAHDPAAWPGVLLPGTYNAIMCRDLLDALDTVDAPAVQSWLLDHRLPDGRFRLPGMHPADVYKKPDPAETWRYLDWHATNYAIGAIEALNSRAVPRLDFISPYLDPTTLKAWLADRDLRDPWQEGNNQVNLGSFLILLRRHALADPAAIDAALAIQFDWHDRMQEPATGFWGVGQAADDTMALHAMAGSMHDFHLYYATGRSLPYQAKAIDWSLSRPPVIVSACIDVDLVDLLAHGHAMLDHRRPDIETWFRALLPRLLDFQSADGGFPDELTGTRRQDGWIRGYSEPQGLSNTFATWFRWIAIAFIAETLWPGWRAWSFRRTPGLGYRLEPLR